MKDELGRKIITKISWTKSKTSKLILQTQKMFKRESHNVFTEDIKKIIFKKFK